MFSPPLNTWRQHFNAQGDEPARFVALTDAPVIINRFRNLEFVFNNTFIFSDRFGGEDGYFSGKGKEVQSHRTWDSNFIADVPGFRLMEHSAAGKVPRASCSIFRPTPSVRISRNIPWAPIRGLIGMAP